VPRGGKKAGTRDLVSRERLSALCNFLRTDRKLSVRACLYRLSAMTRPGSTEKLYPGTDSNSYRSLKQLIRTARISGELDERLGCVMDDCFIDNKRVLLPGETEGWATIDQYMGPSDPRYYRRNPWQDQADRIQVWLEKDTLAGLIRSVCSTWDVSQVISMGGFGRTLLLRTADRIADPWPEGSKSASGRTYIFYVGDFDPSGLAIEKWAQRGNDGDGNRRTEGLLDIMVNRHQWTRKEYERRIIVKRIAVTADYFLNNPQLEEFKISIKDAGYDEETGACKTGHDPRAEDYKKLYGDKCLEAEALEVLNDGEISTRLDVAIQSVIDMDAWAANDRRQRREIRKWLMAH